MLNDDEFLKILQYLDRPWAGYRKVRKGVKKRLCRHMTALDCKNFEAYLEIIRRQPHERWNCERALTVTISRFNRDRHLWQSLAQRILPDLISRFDTPINIWSAGCASGEEAYSLAMTFQQLPLPPKLKILATDFSEDSLGRAQDGIYNQSSLKELSAEQQAKFFRPQGKNRKIILSQRLPPIRWQRHNLMDAPPKGPFHIIFLRNNLLTYYQGAAMATAFGRITDQLIPGGLLVVGAHERLPDIKVPFSRDPSCPYVYELSDRRI